MDQIEPKPIEIGLHWDHLTIKLNQYPSFEIVNIIKSCPAGRRYDSNEKAWIIPLCLDNLRVLANIPEIQKDIIDLGHRLIPQVYPETTEIKKFQSVTMPLEHQKKYVSFLLEYISHGGHGFLLFGGLGTGKTAIMAYLIMNKFSKSKILIVCPNKVKPVWVREMEKHAGLTGFSINSEGSSKKKRNAVIASSNRLIVNYESLSPDIDALIEKKFDIIVFDESHRIKNPGAICTKNAILLSRRAAYCFCLTGTPRSNSDLDLFSQCQVVNPWLFGANYYAFRAHWFHQVGGFDMKVKGKKINTGKWVLKPEKKENFQLLIKMIAVHIPVDVLSLPPITYIERYATMPSTAREKYNRIKKDLILNMQENGIKLLKNGLARDSKLLQICSGAVYGDGAIVCYENDFKAMVLVDIVENEIGETDSAIVWFNYLHTLKLVEKTCLKAGISFISVHGGVENITEKVTEFNSSNSIRLLLATNCIAEGQTILRPSYTIKFDHDFNSLPDWQRTARNYRHGQDKPVIVIDIVTEETIEIKAYSVLTQNEEDSRKLLESLTIDDIKN